MEYVYRTQGTCSTNIELNVEDGVVKEVAFWGGCNGNLQGISRQKATSFTTPSSTFSSIFVLQVPWVL